MDTTPENILMCEKSGLRCPRAWAPCGNSTQSIIRIGDDIFALRDGDSTAARWVWLPSQDQLQEMLRDIEKFDTSVHNLTLSYHFARFCGIDNEDAEGSSNIYLRKGSMEKLWLAFVMHEKHGKHWNGKDWKKK